MKVVGVAAQLAMGKDVLCDYLAVKLNSRLCSKTTQTTEYWERSAFANAVKKVFMDSFGVDRKFIEDWKRNPETPPGMLKNIRQALQFVGDGFRKIKDEIWIEIALRDEAQKLIISDSRYINEAKAVSEKGGMMIVLYRPGYLNDDPNPSEAQIKPIIEFCEAHLKEGPIPSIDELTLYCDMVNQDLDGGKRLTLPDGIEYYHYFLRNDKDLESLYAKVDKMLVPFVEAKYN